MDLTGAMHLVVESVALEHGAEVDHLAASGEALGDEA